MFRHCVFEIFVACSAAKGRSSFFLWNPLLERKPKGKNTYCSDFSLLPQGNDVTGAFCQPFCRKETCQGFDTGTCQALLPGENATQTGLVLTLAGSYQYINISIHQYIYMCVCVLHVFSIDDTCVYIYIYAYIYNYIRIYIYNYIYVHTHTSYSMYICTYLYTYCTHPHTHIYIYRYNSVKHIAHIVHIQYTIKTGASFLGGWATIYIYMHTQCTYTYR